MSEYCLLVGFPGNGRTTGIDITKNAINKLDEYNNICFEKSALRQPSCNIALMTSLHENSTLLGILTYNQNKLPFNTKTLKFIKGIHSDSFTNYLQNDEIYRNTLTYLSDTPEKAYFYSKIKTHTILQPRYNLIASCNTSAIKKMCEQYRTNNDDLFLTRMLISSPQPPMCIAQEIREASNEKHIQITAIYFFIEKMNIRSRTYQFSKEALEIFETFFNNYSQKCEKLLQKDTYLA